MIRLASALLLLAASTMAVAQTPNELKTEKQKVSYIFGIQFAMNVKRNNLDLDNRSFLLAIQDVLENKEPRMTREEMQATLDNYFKTMADNNLKAGQAFLEQNNKNKDVITLPSGLQYKIMKSGTGKKPKVTDTVTVNYRGMLINGKEFDSSYAHGEPATFTLDKVIKGWQDILVLMPEGSTWQVFIPSDQAYGPSGSGNGSIGPNEVLIFEIELLNIAAAK